MEEGRDWELSRNSQPIFLAYKASNNRKTLPQDKKKDEICQLRSYFELHMHSWACTCLYTHTNTHTHTKHTYHTSIKDLWKKGNTTEASDNFIIRRSPVVYYRLQSQWFLYQFFLYFLSEVNSENNSLGI